MLTYYEIKRRICKPRRELRPPFWRYWSTYMENLR